MVVTTHVSTTALSDDVVTPLRKSSRNAPAAPCPLQNSRHEANGGPASFGARHRIASGIGFRHLYFSKPVSHAAHGFNQFRVLPEFLAECANVNVDGSLQHHCVVAERGIDQLVAGERAARLAQ